MVRRTRRTILLSEPHNSRKLQLHAAHLRSLSKLASTKLQLRMTPARRTRRMTCQSEPLNSRKPQPQPHAAHPQSQVNTKPPLKIATIAMEIAQAHYQRLLHLHVVQQMLPQPESQLKEPRQPPRSLNQTPSRHLPHPLQRSRKVSS